MIEELRVLKSFCNAFGWPTEESDERVFRTEVPTESGERKTFWILSTDNLIELSVQSGLSFAEETGFPGIVSTMMLNLNSKMDYGFWCLESLSGNEVASVMHNIAPEDLDKATFRAIVTKMVSSCASFEKTIASVADEL